MVDRPSAAGVWHRDRRFDRLSGERNGVVGLKPTVGLTSRAGVVPISHSQDTVGPHARTVADAAAVLTAIASFAPDHRDPATGRRPVINYTRFVDPHGLRGARIGAIRGGGTTGYSEETDRVYEAALKVMRDAGATIVDPADLPDFEQLASDNSEIIVLVFEFKRDLNAYLATRRGVPIRTLADAIAFNKANAARELKWFLQELFELAESDPFSDAEYEAARVRERQLGGELGIDAALKKFNVDALVAPTESSAWTTDLVNGDLFLGASSGPAAMAGYPIIQVPTGNAFGLPVGISFFGTAFSEPTLIKLASGFEAAAKARLVPKYLPALPKDTGVRSFQSNTEPATREGALRMRERTRPVVVHL